MSTPPTDRSRSRPRKTFTVAAGVLALGLAALAASGCSREARYEVLTFFFTGVPPLEEAGAVAGPGAAEPAVDLAALSKEKRAEVLARRHAQLARAVKWAHGPYGSGQCEKCHAFAGSKAFRSSKSAAVVPTSAPVSATSRLLMPPERLCFTCHTTKTTQIADALGLRLHGPVASGLCIGCHSPHQSPRRYMLLGADNVELCTRCHLLEGLKERTPAHVAVDAGKNCLDCHNPHMGKTAMILRSDYREPDAE